MEILSPISQMSLTDTVTEKIKEAIIQGELEPGKRMTEPMLAEMLKVSRSPVRDAFKHLELVGLVVRDPKNGLSVWNPTKKDVDEILTLRVMMESLAAEIMIDKLEDEDFVQLELILETHKQAVAENQLLLVTKNDEKFHTYLIERCNNIRLLEMWNRLMSQIEVLIFRRFEFDSHVFEIALIDHKNILDAMKAKNLERIIHLHKETNQRAGQAIKEFLDS